MLKRASPTKAANESPAFWVSQCQLSSCTNRRILIPKSRRGLIYHPELYAPELYARAFDLYAKRKADEKEWAEFHPAATIMRYCRKLPAPAPYWEPPTYKTGSCCFCGQLRVLPFAAPTQEEADQYATDKCDCEIGKACRRQREEREIICQGTARHRPEADGRIRKRLDFQADGRERTRRENVHRVQQSPLPAYTPFAEWPQRPCPCPGLPAH